MKILHLSDIHFGRNHTELKYREPMEKHDEILNGLIGTIVSINQEQSIDHIIVTGDIAWYGKKKEYNEALIWFNKLLGAIGVL